MKSLNSDSTVRKANPTLMKKALNYKFRLEDIGKYSSKLRFKDINWKLKRSALGKVIPDNLGREKRLLKASFLNKLYLVLKNTDWQRTPIYQQYVTNKGRFQHNDKTIYSEIELKYLLSSL